MPLRMLIDSGAVEPEDVALLGARNLDPPEVRFIAASGIRTGAEAIARAVDGAKCTYVAFDADPGIGGEMGRQEWPNSSQI